MTTDRTPSEAETRAPLGRLIESACDARRWDAHRPSGGDRVADLKELNQRLRPHFAAAGITRVAEVTGLDRIGIPVALAVRPNSRSLSVAQGKGVLKDEAFISAVMEALELAAAERLPDSLKWASLAEMTQANAPVMALDISTRCRLDRLNRNQPLAWVQGYDLTADCVVNVPWSLVGADYRPDPPGFHGAFQVSTDGLASGFDYRSAIFHGLCELIERDASALLELMSTAELSKRLTRVQATDGLDALQFEQRIRAAGFDLTLLDMTSDIGLPAITAIVTDSAMAHAPQVPRYAHSAGAACHASRGQAIVKAIAEAAQSRITRITGSRDDLFPEMYEEAEGDERKAIVELLAFIDPSGPAAPARPVPDLSGGIRALVALLQKRGIEQVIAVPLKNDFGITVVRMIVPGLQTELTGPRSKLGVRALATLIGRLH
ncbi:YcaO-like family protein [Dongia sp.]|uniref:YcaO-like family protein n=1 Tax=Dongia sp. TaxID=1977262 RepID=UPI0037528139